MKLKYKRIILFITMCTMCIGLVTLFISESPANSNNGKVEKDKETDLPASNPPDQNTPVPTASAAAKLEWETKPEITNLLKKYFDACLANNIGQLSEFVTNVENINQEKIKSKYALIDSYQNIECFITQQPNTANYLVYVSIDWKLTGIDTFAPSLDSFFVTQKEDGSYSIFNGEIDAETNDFIDSMDQSEDVQKLIQSVNLKYNEAITKDAKLQEIFSQTNETAAPTQMPTDSNAND